MSGVPGKWVTTSASRARFGGMWVFRRTYDNGSTILVRIGDQRPSDTSRRVSEEQRAHSGQDRALQLASADFSQRERDAGMDTQAPLTRDVFEGEVRAEPLGNATGKDSLPTP
jgi:hypothetical protein